jgi:ribonuclease G
MQNEIIINADRGETRVAILERSSFTELYIERENDRSVVSNVVKGRVSRVLPGMQAAFVDIGLEKAGFLYAGDYFEMPSPDSGKKSNGNGRGRGRGGRPGNSRNPPQIDTMLREGQEIVVQIAKEPIGSKGARITSNISVAGRHLVLTPWASRVGVSRRIDSDKERRRLREIVERLRPRELGFIIRTAGDGVREADLEADIRYLAEVWKQIQERNETTSAPSVLYSEPDLPLRMIRDFANADTKRIAIDSDEVHGKLKDFVDRFVADPKPRIEHYRESEPIFDRFSLEAQIHANLERKVWLRSGGHLVVDQSEALTAIDVNTGRFIGKRDLEETVFKTNLEAVKEVVYQLRFRNIGGLIIIDLIDMESAENRDRVYRALQEALRADKARTNILKISELGLVEMTRKRTRENLVQTLCEPCPNCEGRGYVLSRESVAFKVLREIRKDLPRICGRTIAISVNPRVAEQLLSAEKEVLDELATELGREIEIRARPGLHQEQFEVVALDEGPAIEIPLRWLSDKPEDSEEVPEKVAELSAPEGIVEPAGTDEAVEASSDEAAPEAAASEPVETTESATEPEAVATSEAPSDVEASAPEVEAAPDETPEAPGETPEPEPPISAQAQEEPENDAQPLDVEVESPIMPPAQKHGDS